MFNHLQYKNTKITKPLKINLNAKKQLNQIIFEKKEKN